METKSKFSTRERVKSFSNTNNNELIFIGGVSENLWLNDGKNFSRNHKQGYRVYSSNGIANTISSNGGGLGGCSGLYLINTRSKDL